MSGLALLFLCPDFVESLQGGCRRSLVERIECGLNAPVFSRELTGFSDPTADHDRVFAKNVGKLS